MEGPLLKGLYLPKQMQRKNGWQRPWNPYQIILWIVYILGSVAGFGFFIPVLPELWQTVSYVCLAVLYVWGFICYVLTVSINPSSGGEQNSIFNPVKCVWDSKTCCCFEHQQSIHGINYFCKICNKNVENHDHHCHWLNTCIGGRNYRLFINVIVTGFLITFQLSATALYIISVFYIKPRIQGTGSMAEISVMLLPVTSGFTHLIPGVAAAILLLIIASVSAVIFGIAFLFLGCLVAFHTYLICIGKSTSEYIFTSRGTMKNDEGNNDDVEAGRSEHSNNDVVIQIDDIQADAQSMEPRGAWSHKNDEENNDDVEAGRSEYSNNDIVIQIDDIQVDAQRMEP